MNSLDTTRAAIPALGSPKAEHVLTAVALTLIASTLSFGYIVDVLIPLRPAVLLFAIVSMWALTSQSVSQLSLLPRLSIFLYAVCFSATLGHLFSDDYVWWSTPAASALIRNEQVSADMMTVGLVGLLGLLTGFRLHLGFSSKRHGKPRQPLSSLGPLAFLIMVCVAVALSWLVAPSATILSQAYNTGGAASAAAPMNFNAAYLLSYLVIILAYVDAEAEPSTSRRRLKFFLIVAATAFIVGVLQILRGDRESASLLAGLALLYLTGSGPSMVASHVAFHWKRIRKIVVPAAALLVIFVAVGTVRASLSSAEGRARLSFLDALATAAQENTWTSVLLTNLGQSGQFHQASAEYLYGQTYLDYLLSLPPGFLTRPLGIERPLEAHRGPNWWFVNISAGGIHVVVVPFRNFGVTGAFVVLLCIGVFIASVETANARRSLAARFLYGSVTVATFFWFWYGDMYIIRGLMAAAVLLPVYSGWLQMTRTWAAAPRGASPVPEHG